MKTSDKVLAILRLFTAERSEWTVEAAATELGLAQTTAYEYFRSLVQAELLVTARQGRYVIGPAIVELDRLARRTDPLLVAGESLLDELCYLAPARVVALLCRFYRMKVMCVAERGPGFPGRPVSYERGRLMPLMRGAASKVILAHVERRRLRRLFDENAEEVAANGLGGTWDEFRHALRDIRSRGVLVTRGELDQGLIGISAPVLGPENAILGSISFVVEAESYDGAPAVAGELARRIDQAGRSLSYRLGYREPDPA